MIRSATLDRVLGRDRLDVVDGTVDCPIRAGRLDVEACASCPYWFRTETIGGHLSVVVCRSRTLSRGNATLPPPS